MALTDNLLSFYECEEASGNLVDVHAANDWTDNATVGTAAGKLGNARDFESLNSEYFSSSSNDFEFAGNFGIMCWLKVESFDSLQAIVSRGYDGSVTPWMFAFRNSGATIELRRYDGASDAGAIWTISGVDFTDGFHHVAATRSGTTWTIWVDGTQRDSQTASLTTESGTVESTIGAQNVNGTVGRFFDGIIDELGFWSRAIVQDDVDDHYNGGAGVAYSSFGGAATRGIPFGTRSTAFNGGRTFAGVIR